MAASIGKEDLKLIREEREDGEDDWTRGEETMEEDKFGEGERSVEVGYVYAIGFKRGLSEGGGGGGGKVGKQTWSRHEKKLESDTGREKERSAQEAIEEEVLSTIYGRE